jgi:hypothetical protein
MLGMGCWGWDVGDGLSGIGCLGWVVGYGGGGGDNLESEAWLVSAL